MLHKILATALLTGSILSPDRLVAEDTADAVAADPIDACSLLRTAELEEAVGQSVAAGVRSDSGYVPNGSYSSTCVWQITLYAGNPDDRRPPGREQFVILNAMQWPDNSGLSGAFLDSFRDAAARGELPTEPVRREIGDEALWWGDGLAVRKGDVSFGVSVFVPDKKSSGAIEEKLANHVVRKLGEAKAAE
jgi:hypothetical protein